MWNKSKEESIYINDPDKRVRLGHFIGPFILYYIMALVGQILWGVWNLPKILLQFINGNEAVKSLMSEGYESLDFFDLITEFMLRVGEDEYFDFIYELTLSALDNIAIITVISALISIPFFLLIMGNDRRKNRVYIFKKELKWKGIRYGYILLGSVVMCVALNNMITLSNLAEMSESYEETAEALYSISFPFQLVGLGMIVPIFEELLYRGVIYNRLKVNLSKFGAIGVSAFIFGTMHGNLVQMLYAFILGVVFAWLYDVYKSIWAPILAHMCMNLTSVILSEIEVFEWIFMDPMRVGVVTVLCATSSAAIYVKISNLIAQDSGKE